MFLHKYRPPHGLKKSSVKFDPLKALHVSLMLVSDQDLELLAKTRCKDLQNLNIWECQEFSEKGLLHVSRYCNDLRSQRLEDNGMEDDNVTHMGLIALVQGCTKLENLAVTLFDISHEALECVGTHLKNLGEFRMYLSKKASISMTTDLPLDNGILAMLKGCIKLKRLTLSLCDGGLTEVGLGYIGKYGHNLRNLFLSCKGVSVAGLVMLSKGCAKLRKLYLEDCPLSEQLVASFVFRIHSLRYVWVDNGRGTHMALTRPTCTT